MTQDAVKELLGGDDLPGDKIDHGCDLIDRMITLELEKIETLKELKKCYRLAQLLGRHPNDMKGVKTCIVKGDPPFSQWRDTKLRVTFHTAGPDADIVDHVLGRMDVNKPMEFPLLKIHHDLWPPEILADYKLFLAGVERRREEAKAKHNRT